MLAQFLDLNNRSWHRRPFALSHTLLYFKIASIVTNKCNYEEKGNPARGQPYIKDLLVERWKKSMDYCFVPEYYYVPESHTVMSIFFFFVFCFAIFAGPRIVQIQKFCYHCNLTKRLPLSTATKKLIHDAILKCVCVYISSALSRCPTRFSNNYTLNPQNNLTSEEKK